MPKQQAKQQSKIPQTAQQVIDLGTAQGLGELARVLGCTRKQAEECFVLAARVVAHGGVLDPADIPVGTVKQASDRTTGLPPAEPAPFDPEAEAQTRARRIRSLPTSEQARALSELASREGSMRRSVAAGYPEWEGELRIIERVRALVSGVVI